MPTTIAIESKPATAFGVTTPFDHLYLVKRVTDQAGKVIEEKVIRGGIGGDFSLVIQADIDLAISQDARGSATLGQRHHTVLDLDGRDPDEVWGLMVQHARNIGRADLEYSVDLFNFIEGGDVNSNTVAASALHAVGINLARNFPTGIEARDVPLYNRLGAVLVDDVLVGFENADVIFGGVGNDRMTGGNGDDRINGELGTDVLIGGSGSDWLNGGLGADRMNGGLGNDTFYIDDSGDRVIETSTGLAGGTDRVLSFMSLNLRTTDLANIEELSLRGSGDLRGWGNDLTNVLIGNAYDNLLSGGNGNDILSGGAGADNLVGGAGNDSLRGGSGNDRLTGGVGRDILSGAQGADVFVFKSTYESRPDPTARDVIVGFDAADVINVQSIDADSGAAGNQSFSFIGSASFTSSGQIRVDADGVGNTIVQANVDSDLAADFEVVLQGFSRGLAAGDFVL